MDLRLYHNSHDFYYRSAFGAVPSGSQLILRLGASGQGEDCRAEVRLWQSNVGESHLSMTYEEQPLKPSFPFPRRAVFYGITSS